MHVGTDADARLAIEAGANGLEHAARGLSDETIALMAAKQITFTPTNVVLDYAWKRRRRGRRRSAGAPARDAADAASLCSTRTRRWRRCSPTARRGDSDGAGVCRLAGSDGAGHQARACRSSPGRTPAIP